MVLLFALLWERMTELGRKQCKLDNRKCSVLFKSHNNTEICGYVGGFFHASVMNVTEFFFLSSIAVTIAWKFTEIVGQPREITHKAHAFKNGDPVTVRVLRLRKKRACVLILKLAIKIFGPGS